jgi:serine/threonine-protein kinase RsbW
VCQHVKPSVLRVAFGVSPTAEIHTRWLLGRPCLLIVTLATTELRFASRIEAVNEAANAVSEFLSRAGVSEDAAFGIDMAVREAITNAVLHGNKLDETKLMEVSLKTSPGTIEIAVHDQGSGFSPNDIPDPTKEENLLKTSGRGIFFMRNFMDEVEWLADPKGGTTVRMVKKL